MNLNIYTVMSIYNIFVFLLFGFDKLMAKKKKARIPEILLVLFSLFFAGFGAAFGMLVFNHKTSKMLFRLIVPLSVIINYVFIKDSFYYLSYVLTNILNIIPK